VAIVQRKNKGKAPRGQRRIKEYWMVDLVWTFDSIHEGGESVKKRIQRKIPEPFSKTNAGRLRFQRKLIQELEESDKDTGISRVANSYKWARHRQYSRRKEIKYSTWVHQNKVIESTILLYFCVYRKNPNFSVRNIDYHEIEKFKDWNSYRRDKKGKPLKDSNGEMILKSKLTQAQNLSVLCGLLKYALERRWIKRMPDIKRIPKQKDQYTKAKTKAWSLVEVKEVLKCIPEETRLGFRLRDFSECMYYSGLRINECLALQWTDLDDSDKKNIVLHVHRTFIEGRLKKKSEQTNTPKAGKATIIIDKRLYNIFMRQPKRSKWIFTKENGEPQPSNTIQRIYRRLDCPHGRITAHRFRHSTGRLYVDLGVQPRVIANMLRHVTTQATEVYMSASRDQEKEAARKSAQAISKILKE
jgi:integrase